MMDYNHEDAVTIRTNGRKNDVSALWALRNVLEGKALIYDTCTDTPHDSLNPCEGITLKLADAPDWECNMTITFLPYLSDDGRALLKIDCQNDADEKIVPTAYDWMDELDELDDLDIDTIF